MQCENIPFLKSYITINVLNTIAMHIIQVCCFSIASIQACIEASFSTVEPPKKGHFGDNINSAVVSFVERLSALRKMY